MPEGFHVAEAYVTVSPDTDGFAEKLQADLERYDFDLKIPVSPDTDGFVEKAQADIRAQGAAGNVEVPVDPDAEGFREKVAALTEGEPPVDVPVDPDAADFTEKLAGVIERSRIFVTGSGGVTIPVSYDVNEGSFARVMAATAAVGTAEAALAAETARTGSAGATAYRLWGTGINLTATGLHALISGTIELAAVLIPATVAAGTWAAVWAQGAGMAYQHMMALYTATESLGQAAGHTFGEEIGLTGALQAAQNAANPQVYEALGAAISIVKEHFGDLAQTGLQMGSIFDTFSAKVVYDMSAAGGAGGKLNDVMSAMVPDLQQLGQIFGNLGHALLNLAADMPGAANMLLDFLDTVSHLIEVISGFPKWLIESGFALHEFNTWGSVAVAGLGRLGLAAGEVEGNFIGFTRAAGILKNVFALVPTAMYQFGNAVSMAGAKLPFFSSEVKAAGLATAEAGEEAEAAVAGLGTFATLGIGLAVAALAFFTYKAVTATSASERFADSLQDAVNKASNFADIELTAADISKLGDAAQKAGDQYQGLARTAGDVSKPLEQIATGLMPQLSNVTSTWTTKMRVAGFGLSGYIMGFLGAADASRQLTAAQQQMAQEFVNIGVGAVSLAEKYHTTLAGGMELAQQAGVKLTQTLQGNSQAAIIARTQIADLVQGYIAMGQPVGVIGSDMDALAISAGLQSSKVQQLNQAWDAYMQTLTGGTSGIASFEQSVSGLTTGVNSVTTILGKSSSSITLSASQFADSLKTYTGKGAQAWQNFGQVVGSTAPQVIDWLRTAGAMGAVSGSQFTEAVRAMVAQMLPFAADSKAATAELSGLAQEAGGPATDSYRTLKQWVDAGAHSQSGLNSVISDGTIKMGNMAAVAQKLGNVMQQDIVNMMGAAALKASGAAGAMTAYAKAIEDNTENTSAGEGARAKLIADLEKTGMSAKQAQGYVRVLQAQIDGLHGKNVLIDIEARAVGISGSTARAEAGTGTAGGAVIPGYAPGRDTVGPIWASPGESILVPELTRALGPANIMAWNRAFSGGRKSGPGMFAGGTGDLGARATFGYPQDVFNITIPVGVYDRFKWNILGGEQRSGASTSAMEKAGETIARAFASHTLLTASAIRADADKAIADLKKYYSGPAASRLEGLIGRQSAAMEKLARTISQMKTYAAGITSNLKSSYSDLSDLTNPSSGNITGASIKQQLQQKLATLRKFFRLIGELSKDKLGRGLISQVVALGPDEGVEYAEAILSGGHKLISELNKIEGEIGGTEKAIGNRAAEIQYRNVLGKGFVGGLDKEKAAIEKRMREYGDEIARELARALHVPLKDIPGLDRHHDQPGGRDDKVHHHRKGHIGHPQAHIEVHLHGSKGHVTPEELAAIKREIARAVGVS